MVAWHVDLSWVLVWNVQCIMFNLTGLILKLWVKCIDKWGYLCWLLVWNMPFLLLLSSSVCVNERERENIYAHDVPVWMIILMWAFRFIIILCTTAHRLENISIYVILERIGRDFLLLIFFFSDTARTKSKKKFPSVSSTVISFSFSLSLYWNYLLFQPKSLIISNQIIVYCLFLSCTNERWTQVDIKYKFGHISSSLLFFHPFSSSCSRKFVVFFSFKFLFNLYSFIRSSVLFKSFSLHYLKIVFHFTAVFFPFLFLFVCVCVCVCVCARVCVWACFILKTSIFFFLTRSFAGIVVNSLKRHHKCVATES